MNRLAIKGLFADLDTLYNNAVEYGFKKSGLTAEEFEKFYIEKQDRFSEIVGSADIDRHRKNYNQYFKTYYNSILAVQKALVRNYKKTFQYYFTYVSTCHTILDKILKQIDGQAYNETDTIAISLYGHLLRKADQVGIMLLNGYDDRAYIIWRAFYEFAVTLKFIVDQDDANLTKKFREHNIRHVKKLSDSYSSRLVSEGFDAIKEDETNNINTAFDEFNKKYGKVFAEGEYGWAIDVPSLKNKPTLRGIEDAANMGRYRPFYLKASSYTHASFEVFKDISVDDKIIVGQIKEVQPVVEDFVDPMQITLAVMQDVNKSFLRMIAHENELDFNLELLEEMYMQLIDFFQENTE